MRRARTVFSAGLLLLLASCRLYEGGGTFHAELQDPRAVSLQQLDRYYREQSGGLISLAVADTQRGAADLTFTEDPFNRRRIVGPSTSTWEELQDLFVFDQERFVRESGEADFLTAVYARYSRMPFDKRRLAHIRPYRALAAWGGLFYPPIKRLTHPLGFYNAPFAFFEPDSLDTSPYFDPEFQKQLDAETQTELTYGNTLQALFNGVQSYPEKLRMTEQAQRFLFVAVMAIVADSTGRELITRMVNRKRAGVDVRLIVDDFYTFSISSFAIGILEQEGIPVARVADKRLNQFDRMFHNKFWIRDGDEAILGGMNVLDYENTATGFDFQNRDTDVLIRGPAVTNLLEDFVTLWRRYDKAGRSIAEAESLVVERRAAEVAARVRGSDNYARWLGDPATRMNGICRTAVQGDDADTESIVTLLTRYAEKAQRSFSIKTPGIECDVRSEHPGSIDRLASVLLEKCRWPDFSGTFIANGIDGGWGESTIFLRSRVLDSELVGDPVWVDIMTPVIDGGGREVANSLRLTTRPFLEVGTRVFQYINYIHAKEFIFDRTLVGIASWNFDSYSADNNHESAIFCLDTSLREQMERQLVLDIVNAVPVQLR